jgi:alpha-1,2-mannosyltransferase
MPPSEIPQAIAIQKTSPSRSDRRLLWFVVLNILAANTGIKLVAHFVFHAGVDEMRNRYADFLHFRQFTDSWGPMLGSVNYFLAHPQLPIYQARLYDTLIYPLTSILPLFWMKRAGMSDPAVLRSLIYASWLAVCAVVTLQVLLAQSILRSHRERLSWPAAVATALAAFFFMPITLAFSLGQAQIFLDVLFALALLFWLNRMDRAAGIAMALLTMIKPQFGILLLWAALRRKWSALVSGIAMLSAGALASIAAFGIRNNIDYLHVLAELSRKAQSHYANQSMFGLLNRGIFNGENLPYHPYVYPPFVPWVYYVTLATSAALILLVLAYPWRERAGTIADLGAAAVVCVIATPMAWEHHYGVLLGLFVWLWFAVYRETSSGRVLWLALAWILVADFLSPFNYFAPMPVLNVLQSYMYFGALLLLFLLLRTPLPYRAGLGRN